MKLYILLVSFLICGSAQAWDCNYWSQSTNPKAECYKAPSAPAGGNSSATATQTQGQQQGQHQSSSNSNVNKNSSASKSSSLSAAKSGSKSNSNAVTGPSYSNSSALTGPSTSNATNGGNTLATSSVNSGNYTEAAGVVQPAMMIIQGCQVQGQAGGSNTRAAGMLGIGFTPKNCYDYMQAQAYLAIGAIQAACEILNHTEAAARAVKAGAKLPDCAPPIAEAVATPHNYVTQEELNLLVKRGLVK